MVTRQRRVTDILNLAEDRFLVLSRRDIDEFGSHGETIRAEFAQVNLGVRALRCRGHGGRGAGPSCARRRSPRRR